VFVTNGVTVTSVTHSTSSTSGVGGGSGSGSGSGNGGGGGGGGGSKNTAAIVGGVLGGVVCAIILVVLVWYLFRRKRMNDFDGNFDPDAHLPQPATLKRKDLDLGGEDPDPDPDPDTDAQPRPWNYPNQSHGLIPGLPSNAGVEGVGGAGPAYYYANTAPGGAGGTGGPPEMSQYDPSMTSGSHYPTTAGGPGGDRSTTAPSESANGGYGPSSSMGSKALEAAAARYGSGYNVPGGSGGLAGGGLGVINGGEMDEIVEDGQRQVVVAKDAGRLTEVEIPPAYDTITNGAR